LTAFDSEAIKTAALKGRRPPMEKIKGNAALVSFAKQWIPRCWHKSPSKRPSFDSKHSNVEIYSTTIFIWIEVAFYVLQKTKTKITASQNTC